MIENIAVCVSREQHRLISLLKDILTIYGENIFVRIYEELTKIHETVMHMAQMNLLTTIVSILL